MLGSQHGVPRPLSVRDPAALAPPSGRNPAALTPLGTEKMPKYLVLKGKNFFPAPSAPENTPIYPNFHFLLHF